MTAGSQFNDRRSDEIGSTVGGERLQALLVEQQKRVLELESEVAYAQRIGRGVANSEQRLHSARARLGSLRRAYETLEAMRAESARKSEERRVAEIEAFEARFIAESREADLLLENTQWLARERRVLHAVFALSDGIPGAEIDLEHIAQVSSITVQEASRVLAALAADGMVEQMVPHPRRMPFDTIITLTKIGASATRNWGGAQVSPQRTMTFNASVTMNGGIIGDNGRVENLPLNPEVLNAQNELLAAIRALQSTAGPEHASRLKESLNQLTGPEDKRLAVSRIIKLGAKIGSTAIPMLDFAQKLKDLLGD